VAYRFVRPAEVKHSFNVIEMCPAIVEDGPGDMPAMFSREALLLCHNLFQF
jgi:hypothetical protein